MKFVVLTVIVFAVAASALAKPYRSYKKNNGSSSESNSSSASSSSEESLEQTTTTEKQPKVIYRRYNGYNFDRKTHAYIRMENSDGTSEEIVEEEEGNKNINSRSEDPGKQLVMFPGIQSLVPSAIQNLQRPKIILGSFQAVTADAPNAETIENILKPVLPPALG